MFCKLRATIKMCSGEIITLNKEHSALLNTSDVRVTEEFLNKCSNMDLFANVPDVMVVECEDIDRFLNLHEIEGDHIV